MTLHSFPLSVFVLLFLGTLSAQKLGTPQAPQAGAQSRRVAPKLNAAPTISSDVEEGEFFLGDAMEFQVTVDDPEGLPKPTPIASLSDEDFQIQADNDLGTFLLGDMSGDGILDIIAFATSANIGAFNVGAAYVWLGGSSLLGEVSQAARLRVPGASADASLGRGGLYRLVDLTGDGILDVVAAGNFDSSSSIGFHRAIMVWEGGVTFSGSMGPSAILAPSGAAGGDLFSTSGNTLLFGDMTGDGVSDVVTALPI